MVSRVKDVHSIEMVSQLVRDVHVRMEKEDHSTKTVNRVEKEDHLTETVSQMEKESHITETLIKILAEKIKTATAVITDRAAADAMEEDAAAWIFRHRKNH